MLSTQRGSIKSGMTSNTVQALTQYPTAAQDKKGEAGKATFSTQQAFIGHL